jgi:hypothetical protein
MNVDKPQTRHFVLLALVGVCRRPIDLMPRANMSTPAQTPQLRPMRYSPQEQPATPQHKSAAAHSVSRFDPWLSWTAMGVRISAHRNGAKCDFGNSLAMITAARERIAIFG